MADELHLAPAHADVVQRTLKRHLPAGSRVRAFGSRVSGQGLKPHSDLDLLIDAPGGLPIGVIANLREAFAESDLPFAVDLLQQRDVEPGFLARLERSTMIELAVG